MISEMEASKGPIWVIAEQSDSQVLAVSLQLVGHARKLADQVASSVEVVLLGHELSRQARQLIAAGADRIYLAEDPRLASYQPELFGEIITQLAQERNPEIVLIGSTSIGRELAPQIAVRLGTGLTAHCVDLVINQAGLLEQKVPAFGGILTILCPEKRPQMASVARGVFPAPAFEEERNGEVVSIELPEETPERVQILEVVRQEGSGIDLETASMVVAGGAGAGDSEGWRLIADLASTLNAALGCTRPAVDEGWANLDTMIGQSGKMISPELYIGVGISGELQHMVGITGARVMVGINNDPHSPLFDQVDYGIVGDYREFIPLLIEKIKQYQQKGATF